LLFDSYDELKHKAATGVSVGIDYNAGQLELLAGDNTVIWNITDDIAAGVYILRATDSNGFAASRRFTVLK